MSLKSYHFSWLSAHPEHTEQWLREKLQDGFHVHHVDFDHSNDDPANLVLVFGDDHLANLHGWKSHRRSGKARAAAIPEAGIPLATGTKRRRSRGFANPPEFKRDPSIFKKWQLDLGLSNAAAARLLYVSENSIAQYRKIGAPADKSREMWAIVAGINPDTPFEECRQMGILNKALDEIERSETISAL